MSIQVLEASQPRGASGALALDALQGRRADCRGAHANDAIGAELRIYYNGLFLRSEIPRDGRTVGEVSEQAERDLAREGLGVKSLGAPGTGRFV